MRPVNNWEQVKEAEAFESMPAGGYVAVIKNVEDDANKECLKISFDIAEGEFKNYYMSLYNVANFWGGNFWRSYKESAARFFKSFITAVSKSNHGFMWDWNEQKLKGKLVGVVLQEEEYQGNDGTVKLRLTVQETRSIDEIRKGNFKVKERKRLSSTNTQAQSQSSNSFDDVPFDTFDISDKDIQF